MYITADWWYWETGWLLRALLYGTSAVQIPYKLYSLKLNCNYSNYTEAAATCSAAQQHSTLTVQILYKLYSVQLNCTYSNYTEAAATCSATQQHKKGSKQDLSNYRPIPLLPVFSKVLEKIIYVRLYTHLLNNKILSLHQFGFGNIIPQIKQYFRLWIQFWKPWTRITWLVASFVTCIRVLIVLIMKFY